MGYAISWLAINGNSKDQILAATELRDTEEVDHRNRSPISGAALPDGWYILFLRNYSHPFVKPQSLAKLSAGCQIISCQIEEHVMACSAAFYRNGEKIWDVSHEGDVEILNLRAQGTLPAHYAAIRDQHFKKQQDDGGESADVDYIIEIPLDLAYSICRFKHDELEFDWGRPNFTTLEPIKERSKASVWPWRR